MTEDEAKTKWCPMVRAEGNYESEQACNRYRTGIPQDGTLCIASECMWWVWDADWNDVAADIQEGGNPKQKPTGHCGAIK